MGGLFEKQKTQEGDKAQKSSFNPAIKGFADSSLRGAKSLAKIAGKINTKNVADSSLRGAAKIARKINTIKVQQDIVYGNFAEMVYENLNLFS